MFSKQRSEWIGSLPTVEKTSLLQGWRRRVQSQHGTMTARCRRLGDDPSHAKARRLRLGSEQQPMATPTFLGAAPAKPLANCRKPPHAAARSARRGQPFALDAKAHQPDGLASAATRAKANSTRQGSLIRTQDCGASEDPSRNRPRRLVLLPPNRKPAPIQRAAVMPSYWGCKF